LIRVVHDVFEEGVKIRTVRVPAVSPAATVRRPLVLIVVPLLAAPVTVQVTARL
jgi:hypothetical protein